MLCSKYAFKKNDLEARQSWIYAVLLMSVGPFGPGGGTYSLFIIGYIQLLRTTVIAMKQAQKLVQVHVLEILCNRAA